MVCRVLFFDYKDSEELFFKKNLLENFCIKFFKQSLNNDTLNKLSQDDICSASAICISPCSKITKDIIEKFKNLRVIATRSKEYSHIDIPACLERNVAVVNVNPYFSENDFLNLKKTFKGITSVLCGEKEYRVI